jgi:ribosomal protein S18 acetylase RimI-like enzyme
MAGALTIRPATAADRPALRAATIELQEYERRRHDSRLPGEQIADDYLDWMWRRSDDDGVILVAEIDGVFAGFVAGWVEQADNIAETPDSNRFGLISDLCVMPEFRGRRLAAELIGAIEAHLRRSGIVRLRVSALAANEAARRSYQHAGFAPYEILHEKRIGPDDEG